MSLSRPDPNGTLRFSEEDLEAFSAASHDRNPLHRSAVYARKSAFGRPIVFGVLGGLACLGRLELPRSRSLLGVTLEFVAPMFAGVEYTIDHRTSSGDQVVATLSDGPQLVLRATATLRDGGGGAPSPGGPPIFGRDVAADREPAEIAPGLVVEGRYAPDWERLRRLMGRLQLDTGALHAGHVAALMWCSYLIGMELPGQRALFTRLSLSFEPRETFEPRERASAGEFTYGAHVEAVDRRFQLLKLRARLADAAGDWATGELSAMIQPDIPRTSLSAMELLLPQSTALQGKVALVVGASRGLGAALAQSLATQGCTVLATFQRSLPDAQRVQASVAGTAGRIELLQGDGGEVTWCEQVRSRIVQQHGRLDFLLCSAAPALLPLRLHPRMVDRIHEFVAQAVRLVSVPMAVFLPLVSDQAGWAVTISSSAVDAPPPDWPHYVAAKRAVEGLTEGAAAERRRVSYAIVRPPKLLTELVNTPFGREGALPPERIASRVVARLLGPPAPGRVEVMPASLFD